MPRSLHDLLAKVERVNEESIAKLGRAATVEELSARLSGPRGRCPRGARGRAQPQPDLARRPGPGRRRDVAGEELLGAARRALELVEDRVALRDLLPVLDPREREILRLRFVEDLPQTAIAERVGCSQMQISRLLRRTLERLRERGRGRADSVAA